MHARSLALVLLLTLAVGKAFPLSAVTGRDLGLQNYGQHLLPSAAGVGGGKMVFASRRGGQAYLHNCPLTAGPPPPPSECDSYDVSTLTSAGSNSGWYPSLAYRPASDSVFIATTNYDDNRGLYIFRCTPPGAGVVCTDHDVSGLAANAGTAAGENPSIVFDQATNTLFVATNNVDAGQIPYLWICPLNAAGEIGSCNDFDASDSQPGFSGQLPDIAVGTGKVYIATQNGGAATRPYLFTCGTDGSACAAFEVSTEDTSGQMPSVEVDVAKSRIYIATENAAQSSKPWLFICTLVGELPSACTSHDASDGEAGTWTMPALALDAAGGNVFIAASNSNDAYKAGLFHCLLNSSGDLGVGGCSYLDATGGQSLGSKDISLFFDATTNTVYGVGEGGSGVEWFFEASLVIPSPPPPPPPPPPPSPPPPGLPQVGPPPPQGGAFGNITQGDLGAGNVLGDSFATSPGMVWGYLMVLVLVVFLMVQSKCKRHFRTKYAADPETWLGLDLDQYLTHSHSVLGIVFGSAEEADVFPRVARALSFLHKASVMYITTVAMIFLYPESFEPDEDTFGLERILEGLLVSSIGMILSLCLGLPLIKAAFISTSSSTSRTKAYVAGAVAQAVLVLLGGALSWFANDLDEYEFDLSTVLVLWGFSLGVAIVIKEPVTLLLMRQLLGKHAVRVSGGGNGGVLPNQIVPHRAQHRRTGAGTGKGTGKDEEDAPPSYRSHDGYGLSLDSSLASSSSSSV